MELSFFSEMQYVTRCGYIDKKNPNRYVFKVRKDTPPEARDKISQIAKDINDSIKNVGSLIL